MNDLIVIEQPKKEITFERKTGHNVFLWNSFLRCALYRKIEATYPARDPEEADNFMSYVPGGFFLERIDSIDRKIYLTNGSIISIYIAQPGDIL